MGKDKPMLASDAIDNAIRLLQAAESETNLGVMEQLTRAAEIWVNVAAHLRENE